MADRYDRLSALITRFDLRVLRVPLGEGNMAVFGDPETGAPGRVEIRTRDGIPAAGPNEAPVAACSIDWGGAANPLMAALPATVSLPIRVALRRCVSCGCRRGTAKLSAPLAHDAGAPGHGPGGAGPGRRPALRLCQFGSPGPRVSPPIRRQSDGTAPRGIGRGGRPWGHPHLRMRTRWRPD